jgi:transcription elongation factor GreB
MSEPRLISPEGMDKLREEWDLLYRDVRPKLLEEIAAAAAQGDRSENAEYQYRKKQLGEIDRRVRYLSKRLEAVKVVDTIPTDRDAVYFGAWIELHDCSSGEILRYRIVGPDETDAARGWISIDSPLARAALKKRVDDDFDAALPQGTRRFTITVVRYQDGPDLT